VEKGAGIFLADNSDHCAHVAESVRFSDQHAIGQIDGDEIVRAALQPFFDNTPPLVIGRQVRGKLFRVLRDYPVGQEYGRNFRCRLHSGFPSTQAQDFRRFHTNANAFRQPVIGRQWPTTRSEWRVCRRTTHAQIRLGGSFF